MQAASKAGFWDGLTLFQSVTLSTVKGIAWKVREYVTLVLENLVSENVYISITYTVHCSCFSYFIAEIGLRRYTDTI